MFSLVESRSCFVSFCLNRYLRAIFLSISGGKESQLVNSKGWQLSFGPIVEIRVCLLLSKYLLTTFKIVYGSLTTSYILLLTFLSSWNGQLFFLAKSWNCLFCKRENMLVIYLVEKVVKEIKVGLAFKMISILRAFSFFFFC